MKLESHLHPIVSVIVCCYNSAARLPETLRHLSLQEVPEGFHWEVVVVDNNSTDDTAGAAENLWKQYRAPAPLRVVREPQPGLSYARKKGVEESRGEYLIFCDDDNWLCASYISNTINIFNTNDKIAIVGGTGIEQLEHDSKPYWFEAVKTRYAVGSHVQQSAFVNAVYGAGLAMRKSVYFEIYNAGFRHQLSDRKGHSLSSGGDTELCYITIISGHLIWWQVENVFHHFIPGNRLTKSYIIRLSKDAGITRASLIGLTYLVHGQNPKYLLYSLFKKDFKNVVKNGYTHLKNLDFFKYYLYLLQVHSFWWKVATSYSSIKKSYHKNYWFDV